MWLAEAAASVRNRRECTCYPSNTRRRASAHIFSGHGCVYSVSVLIIEHLVGSFRCVQSSIKRLFSGPSCCTTLYNSEKASSDTPQTASRAVSSFHIRFFYVKKTPKNPNLSSFVCFTLVVAGDPFNVVCKSHLSSNQIGEHSNLGIQ